MTMSISPARGITHGASPQRAESSGSVLKVETEADNFVDDVLDVEDSHKIVSGKEDVQIAESSSDTSGSRHSRKNMNDSTTSIHHHHQPTTTTTTQTDVSVSHLLFSTFLLIILSSLLSLIPVVFPFGDAYDLSVKGYVNNLGYFLGYCGTGWSFLWVMFLMWFRRLKGEDDNDENVMFLIWFRRLKGEDDVGGNEGKENIRNMNDDNVATVPNSNDNVDLAAAPKEDNDWVIVVQSNQKKGDEGEQVAEDLKTSGIRKSAASSKRLDGETPREPADLINASSADPSDSLSLNVFNAGPNHSGTSDHHQSIGAGGKTEESPSESSHKDTTLSSSLRTLLYTLTTILVILSRLSMRASVSIPTAFAIAIFFVMYIILGGPCPLGTLVLGSFCFLCSWWSLLKWEAGASSGVNTLNRNAVNSNINDITVNADSTTICDANNDDDDKESDDGGDVNVSVAGKTSRKNSQQKDCDLEQTLVMIPHSPVFEPDLTDQHDIKEDIKENSVPPTVSLSRASGNGGEVLQQTVTPASEETHVPVADRRVSEEVIFCDDNTNSTGNDGSSRPHPPPRPHFRGSHFLTGRRNIKKW